MTEDKMVGWHHQLNGHESEQTLGAGAQSMGSQRVGPSRRLNAQEIMLPNCGAGEDS